MDDSPSELAKVFPGAKGIYDGLHNIYPNIHDPVQLNSVIKYWQGGPDPLDYISAYANPGNPEINVPPHWHFISYGLTDLHGDGRVHIIKKYPLVHEKSGYGFELTFRLRKELHDISPPLWPARLMQQLAKYVFQSGNPLLHGDHVSWHHSLDSGESSIQHMLMFTDPQVQSVKTPMGTVDFVQIVGITNEELESVQQWNGPSFLELMQRYPQCGGDYLVTDMRRGESIFEIDVAVQEEVNAGICKDGSNLSGVTAQFSWCDDAYKFYTFDDLQLLKPAQREKYFGMRSWEMESENLCNDLEPSSLLEEEELLHHYNHLYGEEENHLVPNDHHHHDDVGEENEACPTMKSNNPGRNKGTPSSVRSSNMGENIMIEDITNQQNKNPLRSSVQDELRMSCGSSHSVSMEPICGEIEEQLETYDSVHLKLNLEASLIIPLALKGRVRHGRHFTFKSSNTNSAITLVAPEVRGSYACSEFPYRSRGYWLHIYMEDEFTEAILKDFEALMATEGLTLPKSLVWPKWNFALTITL